MIFSGLCAVVFLVRIVLRKPRLTIDSYGVTWTQRSDQPIPWTSIENVDILTVGRHQRYLVLWLTEPDRYPPRRPRRRPGPSLTTKWYGGDVHIPLSTLTESHKAVLEAAESHLLPR
jgi:hypothetical protein